MFGISLIELNFLAILVGSLVMAVTYSLVKGRSK
jgi:hypothetical protein